jgi:integrase
MPSADRYLIADAINDYRIEVGDKRVSRDSIAARLNNVLDFLSATDRVEATCDRAAELIEPMREWLTELPVVARRKDGSTGASRPRTQASVEEAVLQFKAALNHAHRRGHVETAPTFQTRTRRQLSQKRMTRCTIDELADMLIWVSDPRWKRRGAIHAFFIGTICTLARPNAVMDINVRPDRGQWHGSVLDLNPRGRPQTKKHRPVVGVPTLLRSWLEHVSTDPASNGWLCHHHGQAVRSIGTAWDSMRRELGLPMTREWGPYILRHSLASFARARGASAWDLAGQMGHRMAATTEIYADGTLYETAGSAISSIIADLEQRCPQALRPRCAQLADQTSSA